MHEVAPAGAYSRVPVWRGREHWLTWVVPAAIGVHRDILRRHRVAPDTLRNWALVKSGYAHSRTGRRCVVRPDTLASVMGVSERTAQRCQAAAREMGLELVITTGRMLTAEETVWARRHGSRQRGLSTESALTIPQAIAQIVDRVTPTSGEVSNPQTSLLEGVPRGLAAERTGAATPHCDQMGCWRARDRPAGWHLAQEVARSVSWLAAEAPSRLAPALSRFATAPVPWTAADVAAAISEHTTRLGAGPIRTETIRTRPAALLAAILRGLDSDTDHPGLHEAPWPTSPPASSVAEVLRPDPCGAPGCDHGWITTAGPDGRTGAAVCPTCHPAVRTWTPSTGPGPGTGAPGAGDPTGWDQLDPPF